MMLLQKRPSNIANNVLGDLFDMLLPMLSIYQEYVRNHHYSLQVLTECKSNTNFATVLKRLEGKGLKLFRKDEKRKKVSESIFSETSMSRTKLGNVSYISHASNSSLYNNTS